MGDMNDICKHDDFEAYCPLCREELRAEVETLRREREELKNELAALHKRIDDSHVHDKRFRMTFSGVQEISLICREDLK